MKINNKGFVATSILYGVVALLLITFLLLLSYYLTENRGNRTVVNNIKEELGDFKYETMKTVDLDPNGGEVYPRKISVKYDGVFGPLPVATMEGHTFIGWYTAKTDGTVVTPTTAYNDVKAKTLYARWEKSKFNLVIDPDGGTIDDSTDILESVLEYKEEYTIPTLTKKGYTFKEWKIEGEGSALTGTLFTMGHQDAKLTAVWEINSYELTVDPKNGDWEGSKDSQTFTLEYNSTKEIPDPTMTGYTFTGWELIGEGATLNSTTFTIGAENVVLTATWKANKYPYFIYHYQQNITADGFTLIDADTKSGEENYGTILEAPVLTYKGFTSPEVKSFVILESVEKNKINYEYLRNKYTLTINPNTGIWNETASDSTLSLYYDAPQTIENPTKDGYRFAGWTINSGTLTDNVYKISDSDANLTANWEANNYIVTYNANGGSVDKATDTYTFDTKYENLPTPTRNGYTFLGWYTEKDGGTKVTTDTVVKTSSDHSIYAHWQINTYKVTIDPNGGSWGNSTTTQTFELTYNTTKNIPIPTKKRYTFMGWTLTGNGSLMTSLTEESTFTMGYQNAKLVANWEPNLAEYVQYSNPDYTSCTNMACAFDELFEKVN